MRPSGPTNLFQGSSARANLPHSLQDLNTEASPRAIRLPITPCPHMELQISSAKQVKQLTGISLHSRPPILGLHVLNLLLS